MIGLQKNHRQVHDHGWLDGTTITRCSLSRSTWKVPGAVRAHAPTVSAGLEGCGGLCWEILLGMLISHTQERKKETFK